MNRFYFLFLSLLFTSFLSAQTFLNEDFSSGLMPPEGWLTFPQNSNWENSATNQAGGNAP